MSLVWRAAAALVIIGLLVAFGTRVDWASALAPDRIEALLAAAGWAAPLAFVLIMALSVVISPIPSLPLDVVAGAYFGWFPGGLLAAVGATGGAVAAFGIARLLGREFVERVVGGHVAFCSECSNHMLTWVVFGSRLIPAVSFDLVSYGAGLTKMSLRLFALATFVGMLPLTFVYTALGPGLWSWVRDSLGLGLGLAVAVGMLAVPWALERWNVLGFREKIRH